MSTDKYALVYKHVVHKTEAARRDRYHGCVSRQTLRAQLRRDAEISIRIDHPKADHKAMRLLAAVESHQEYGRLMEYGS